MADQLKLMSNYDGNKKWREQEEPVWPIWFTPEDKKAGEDELHKKVLEESFREGEKNKKLQAELDALWAMAIPLFAMLSWVLASAIAVKAVLNATLHFVVKPGHEVKYQIREMYCKLMEDVGGLELMRLLKDYREHNQKYSPRSPAKKQRDLRYKSPESAILEACTDRNETRAVRSFHVNELKLFRFGRDCSTKFPHGNYLNNLT